MAGSHGIVNPTGGIFIETDGFVAAENQSATPENPSVPMKNLKHKKGLISLPSAASK
jgi:hypothetical protein